MPARGQRSPAAGRGPDRHEGRQPRPARNAPALAAARTTAQADARPQAAGDPAAQPSRLLELHLLRELSGGDRLQVLRQDDDLPPRRRPQADRPHRRRRAARGADALPLLPGRQHAAAAVPDVRQEALAVRPRHAARRGGAGRQVPADAVRPRRQRHDARRAVVRGAAREVRQRRDPSADGHADARQGPRFSERHARRRHQRRHRAEPPRLSRRRADVSIAHAGRGPRRAGRGAGAGRRADVQPAGRDDPPRRHAGLRHVRRPRTGEPPRDEPAAVRASGADRDPRRARGGRRRAGPNRWRASCGRRSTRCGRRS